MALLRSSDDFLHFTDNYLFCLLLGLVVIVSVETADPRGPVIKGLQLLAFSDRGFEWRWWH
jgi:hypothetical protein